MYAYHTDRCESGGVLKGKGRRGGCVYVSGIIEADMFVYGWKSKLSKEQSCVLGSAVFTD